MPQILTANHLWEMEHDKIVGVNIPREEKSAGMRWVTRGVMFLKFKTRANVEAFKDSVHGIVIMSDTDHRDRLPDFRVTWLLQGMGTHGYWGRLYPKKPR